MNNVVLGIDVGGTYIRVMAVDLSGQVRSFERSTGISSRKSSNKNMQRAIQKVVQEAGCELKDVVCMAAGLKFLNKHADKVWAESFTAIPGLKCRRTLVNDTIVAHAGAFRHQHGITAIGGSGSNLLAVTETGKKVFMRDFRYDTYLSAYDLGVDVIQRVIAGKIKQDDQELVEQLFQHLKVADLTDLRELFVNGEIESHMFRTFAPFVTDAAKRGITLACEVCNRAIDRLIFGMQLMVPCFTSKTVPVALMGSVFRSSYMKQGVQLRLKQPTNKDFKIIEPQFSPVAGAALMALESIGVIPDKDKLTRLGEHPEAKEPTQ